MSLFVEDFLQLKFHNRLQHPNVSPSFFLFYLRLLSQKSKKPFHAASKFGHTIRTFSRNLRHVKEISSPCFLRLHEAVTSINPFFDSHILISPEAAFLRTDSIRFLKMLQNTIHIIALTGNSHFQILGITVIP